ncbi:HAMP domain-containing histidine kinase [Gramella sp. BOM4]|nr:HAMP domain-containing histidine kinase [Christiangramia bathymodioli]
MNLSASILQNKNQIADEWIDFATDNIIPTGKMEREEVKDHVKQILDRIIEDMDSIQTNKEQKIKSHGNKELNSAETNAANQHGEQRLDFGFDFMQLSSEFRALRASVLRLWAEKSREENWKTDFHDMIRFNEAVDEVWMISLKRFQEKLDESKNLFLGILGHDLRNPIATIKGSHSILKLSENLSEKEKKTLQYSDKRVDHMTKLINNLLELTELRLGGGMTVDRAELDLVSLFKEIVHEQQLAFPDIKFISDVDGQIRGNWDKLRFTQMMTNLITNAVKHGKPDGTIKLKLFDDEENAHFSVHNNGSHIPENILEKIFDGRFSTGNGSSAEERSYGLGLLIVKKIIEGHQGEIKVSSSPENGTIFTVIIPKN